MAQPRLKMRLGDLLVQEQIISDDQLQLALQQQRQTGRKLGTTLIDLGFISEVQLLTFLARQLDVPFFDLNNLTIDVSAVALLPEVQARRYRALAVNLSDDKVTVVMSDPADLSALDAIAALLSPRELVLAVAREGQLLEYFDRLYRRTREIENFAVQLHEEHQETGFELGAGSLNAATDEGRRRWPSCCAPCSRTRYRWGLRHPYRTGREGAAHSPAYRRRAAREHPQRGAHRPGAGAAPQAGGRARHLREASAPGWPFQHEGARPRRGCADVHHAGAVRRVRGDAAAGSILRHLVARRDRDAPPS